MLEALKRVPLALREALSAGRDIAALFLQGRRVEAELAAARVKLERARADAASHRHEASARQHFDRSLNLADRINRLEEVRKKVLRASVEYREELADLPPEKVHEAYAELVRKKRQEQ